MLYSTQEITRFSPTDESSEPNPQIPINIYVNKIFIEQNSPEPRVFIPMYEPLEVTKWEKCGKIIAEPKELIRIQKKH